MSAQHLADRVHASVLAEISARRQTLASTPLPLVHGFRRIPATIADNWVTEIAEQLRAARHHHAYDEQRIKDFAANYSAACTELSAPRATEANTLIGFRRLKKQATEKRRPQTLTEKLAACRAFGESVGVEPVASKNTTPEGELARWCDALWWRRQLRKAWTRQSEDALREIGVIRRGKQPYASDAAVEHRAARLERTKKWLESREVVNDAGERLDLATVQKSSVGNPALRRGEFMCRIRGFEELSESLGHTALFFTLTTPSKFHAQLSAGGMNPVWETDRARVREGQRWLCKMWSRARAKLGRMGALFYGVRVAEPHHDGTPHWHAVLFVRPGDVGAVQSVLQSFWLSEDGDEEGAARYRYNCKTIDRDKGSAVGYVAKYISKNIDAAGAIGDEISDETGTPVIVRDGNGEVTNQSPVRRVAAWASVHGIRQFQQLGGPPVGLWRELRRLRDPVEPVLVESVRAVADKGQWRDFIEALGGIERARRRVGSVSGKFRRRLNVPMVRYRGGPRGGWRRRPANRDEMPALWLDKKDATTVDPQGREVVAFTRYQEEAGARAVGICGYGLLDRFIAVSTRPHRWRIERKAGGESPHAAARREPCSNANAPQWLSSESAPRSGAPALGPVAITVRSASEIVPPAADIIAAAMAKPGWTTFNPVAYRWPDDIPKMNH